MSYTFEFYSNKDENIWDDFITNHSMNGTFLQTRKFINYHPEGKFRDCSVVVKKGLQWVAVLLACEIFDNGQKTFFGHKGTTFGGLSIAPTIYSATAIDELFDGLLLFLKENGFQKIYIKTVPRIYQNFDVGLLDYFYYQKGFHEYDELNYYLDLSKYRDDISSNFTSSKRRDYRYSLKSGFAFKELTTKKEIADFYDVLLLNLQKFNACVVHTLEELYDLKFNRYPSDIEFYGVYLGDKIVAGSMLFYFGKNIVHTQYLSSNKEYLTLYPMDFLIYDLIKIGVEKGKDIFSFGICTEDQGRYLNLGLSRFKEGFGTSYCINRSFEKNL